MTVKEVRTVILAYNKYASRHTPDACWCEHAEADDWKKYWDDAAESVYRSIIKSDNNHNII